MSAEELFFKEVEQLRAIRSAILAQDQETIGMIQVELMDIQMRDAKRDNCIYWCYLATAAQLSEALARTLGVWGEESK